MAEVSLISPGAASTQHALRFKGHLAPATEAAEGTASARLEVKMPADAKDLHGIEFEARGDGRIYQVKWYAAGATAPLQPASSFVPLSDWQTVRLLVGWLANPPAGASPPDSWLLEISALGPPGEFQLDLDEIKFY